LGVRLLLALRKSGFIRGFERVSSGKKKALRVFLKYDVNMIPTAAQTKTISTIEKKVSLKLKKVTLLKVGFHFYFFSRFSTTKSKNPRGDFLYALA
jgi:ribosomal protein S8